MILQWAAGLFVMFAPNVLVTICAYLDQSERSTEAGGILIGSYRGPHIEITSCTTPLPKDARRPLLFDRCDPGHQAAALKAWKESSKTLTFVGEWHTHPEPHPSPSGRDAATWRGIMKRVPDPLVFLIGGWDTFWCGIGQTGKLSRASPSDGGCFPALLAPSRSLPESQRSNIGECPCAKPSRHRRQMFH